MWAWSLFGLGLYNFLFSTSESSGLKALSYWWLISLFSQLNHRKKANKTAAKHSDQQHVVSVPLIAPLFWQRLCIANTVIAALISHFPWSCVAKPFPPRLICQIKGAVCRFSFFFFQKKEKEWCRLGLLLFFFSLFVGLFYVFHWNSCWMSVKLVARHAIWIFTIRFSD